MKSLLLHPMRSLLTVLGIFIGVASVIWLLAIGEGISREAQKQIEGLGADNIIIRSIKPPADVMGTSDAPIPYGLKREEFEVGRRALDTKIRRLRPRVLAFVGVTLYRRVFAKARLGKPGAGLKPDKIHGALVFVLPNPSGLNASFPSFAAKLRWFKRLRAEAVTPRR